MNCTAILLCLLPGTCVPGERALLQPAWQPAEGMLPWYPVVHCVQKKRELGKKKKKSLISFIASLGK